MGKITEKACTKRSNLRKRCTWTETCTKNPGTVKSAGIFVLNLKIGRTAVGWPLCVIFSRFTAKTK